MEQHSIYYDCSAKEATARHWRKYCLINFLEIVVIVLICVWTIFSEGEFIIRLIWEAIFVFAVTIATNILIGFNANQFVYILFPRISRYF
mgnify:CR=1 FL=1